MAQEAGGLLPDDDVVPPPPPPVNDANENDEIKIDEANYKLVQQSIELNVYQRFHLVNNRLTRRDQLLNINI